MQNYWLAILLCLFICPSAQAQLWGPDPYYQPNNSAEDLEQVKKPATERIEVGAGAESDDESLGPDEKGELSLNATEVREEYDGSLALGLGTGEAWEVVSLMGSYFYTRDVHFGAHVGGGPWRFTGEESKRRYEVNAVSRVLGAQGRYFFTSRTPVYLQTGTGFSLFTGDVKPIGGDGIEEETQSEADESLRSGFRATAFYLSQQIGWQTNWESGFLLELSVVGFAHTWLIQRSFTKSADAAKKAVNEELEGFTSWGLVNVRLGWLF